jgi:hypothetical protein
MSQIETNLDDSSRQTNKGWMSDFCLRYNQRNFPPIVAKLIARPASCSLCLRSRFSRSMGILLRDGVCSSALERGAETDDSQSHEV